MSGAWVMTMLMSKKTIAIFTYKQSLWSIDKSCSACPMDQHSCVSGCVDYQEEITTEWCSDSINEKNICGGSKEDCLAKGEAKCSADNACYGVMYHPGYWSRNRKGVKFCTSRKLAPKGVWQAFLKCSGNFHKLFLAILE